MSETVEIIQDDIRIDYNAIKTISVNGTQQEIDSNKNVNISVPTRVSDLSNDSGFLVEETDPTVPQHVKNITEQNITNWNNKSDFSGNYNDLTNKPTIPDVSNFITKDVNDLTYYELKTNTGTNIELSINSSTYVMTLNLKNSAGTIISTGTVDLPLEAMVVNAEYDSTTKEIILTLQSGSTTRFSVADLVSGLQTEITPTNKLESDLVDDTNQANKFVTASEKTTWNNKGTYSKPVGGIPKADLDSSVQASLGKADTAIQTHQDITGKEDKANKVITISSSSTNTEYPSALAVYNLFNSIVNGNEVEY